MASLPLGAVPPHWVCEEGGCRGHWLHSGCDQRRSQHFSWYCYSLAGTATWLSTTSRLFPVISFGDHGDVNFEWKWAQTSVNASFPFQQQTSSPNLHRHKKKQSAISQNIGRHQKKSKKQSISQNIGRHQKKQKKIQSMEVQSPE